MIKLIKKYQKLIIAISFVYVFLIFSLVTPSGYSVIMPGGVTNIERNITINDDNFDASNSIYSIYVSSYDNMTFFQYMVALGKKRLDVYKTPQSRLDISSIDDFRRGQVQKATSYDYSLIYAYSLASAKNSAITLDYELIGVRIEYRPGWLSDLNINDLVVGIGYRGVDYMFEPNMVPSEIKGVIDYTNNAEFTLIIRRNSSEERIELNRNERNFRLNLLPDYEFIHAFPEFSTPGLNTNIGGPSGGLMQTLSIYTNLVNLNINMKIAGTGTVDYDGTVGAIGGAVQKVYTAVDNKIDIFFITVKNKNDIIGMSYLGKFNNYYIVETIEEAVSKLEELS